MNILLQITPVTDTVNEPLSVVEIAFSNIASIAVMSGILLLSLIGLYIFFQKIATLKKASRSPDAMMKKVKEAVVQGDIQTAKNICAKTNTPIARMIEKGLARIGSPLKNIETSIDYVGKIEIYRLERGLPMLATIAGAAPMVGFLGTVIGMIIAFSQIANSQTGNVSPQDLAGGISTAMFTTVAGLIVGILANIGYNYLIAQVQKIISNMEYISMDFLDLLQEPR